MRAGGVIENVTSAPAATAPARAFARSAIPQVIAHGEWTTRQGAVDDLLEPAWEPTPAGARVRTHSAGLFGAYYRWIGHLCHLDDDAERLAALAPATPLVAQEFAAFARAELTDATGTGFLGVRGLPSGAEVAFEVPGAAPTLLSRVAPIVPEPPLARAGAIRQLVWEALVASCRDGMTGEARVAVLVSGGVDSSGVAAAAARVAREMGAPPPLLLSLRFPGLACDESALQTAVAQHVGLPMRTLDCTDVPLASRYAELGAWPTTWFLDPLESVNARLYAIAREEGCTALLSGVGGDQLFQARGVEVDLLRAGHPIRAARLVRSFGRARGLGRWPQRFAKTFGPRPYPIDVEERRAAGSWARANVRRELASAFLPRSLGMIGRLASAYGLRFRHPYLSARVRRAAGAATFYDFAMGDRMKGLLREALRPHLPEPVVDRIEKASFAHYYLHRLDDDAAALCDRYATVRPSLDPALELPETIDDLFAQRHMTAFFRAWFSLGVASFAATWTAGATAFRREGNTHE